MEGSCKYGCGYLNEGRRVKIHEALCKFISAKGLEYCIFCTISCIDIIAHCNKYHPEHVVDLSTIPEPKKLVLNLRNYLITQYNKLDRINESYFIDTIVYHGRTRIGMMLLNKTETKHFIDLSMSSFWVSGDMHEDSSSMASNEPLKGSIIKSPRERAVLFTDERFFLDATSLKQPLTVHFEQYEIKKPIGCDLCNSLSNETADTCEEGHKMCINCMNNAVECTLCMERSLQRPGRSWEPCKFKDNGCRVVLPIRKLMQHQNTCLYKTTRCGVNFCTWRGPYKAIKQHCYSVHPFTIKKSPIHLRIRVPLAEKHVKHYFCYGKTFILCTGLQTETHHLFYVHEITRMAISNYSFILKIFYPGTTKCSVIKNQCIASTGYDVTHNFAYVFMKNKANYGVPKKLVVFNSLPGNNSVLVHLAIVLKNPNGNGNESTKSAILNPSKLYSNDDNEANQFTKTKYGK